MAQVQELPPTRRLQGARVVVTGLLASISVWSVAGCNPEEDGTIDLFSNRDANAGSEVPVPCREDRDCSEGAPHCDQQDGECGECTSDAHCDGRECDQRTHQCVGCTDSRECDDSRPICSEGRCVGCVSTEDCDGPNQRCDPESLTCIGFCEADSDCERIDAGVCDATRGVCVGCLTSADCDSRGALRICSDGECVACVNDADCSDSQPHCDVNHGQCEECLEDAHCPQDQVCRDHRCDR